VHIHIAYTSIRENNDRNIYIDLYK
jgi:hypothetical protein